MEDLIKDLTTIPDEYVLTLDPKEITVNENRPRYRTDPGDVKDLLQSIIEKGQIQPIVITRTKQLVCGGRRLAACILGGIKVKAIYNDAVDPLVLRELELEENIKRKNFTPAEEALAVKEIYEIKVAKAKENKSYANHVTVGKDLGMSKSAVQKQIAIADLVQKHPELMKAKTSAEIVSAGKGLQKIQEILSSVKKNEEQASATPDRLWNIRQHDALIDMAEQADDSIDILVTDPPYGINIQDTAISSAGTTGSHNVAGFTFDDSTDNAMLLYKALAQQSFRFTRKNAHAFIFIGPEFFSQLRQIFMDAGWLVYVKPIIWIKRTSGQCNVPHAWPSSCYEVLMYARKQDSRLIQEGKPDWVECNPVLQKQHPTEKPVYLISQLLERVSFPGMSLYDPFMGSGAVIEAGVKAKLYSSGCDILAESYSVALNRLVKL